MAKVALDFIQLLVVLSIPVERTEKRKTKSAELLLNAEKRGKINSMHCICWAFIFKQECSFVHERS